MSVLPPASRDWARRDADLDPFATAGVANEIERARISMMARSSKAPSIGRIQKRNTNVLQIIIFGLQRAGRFIQMGQSLHFALRKNSVPFRCRSTVK
jgi:hypothetical protein